MSLKKNVLMIFMDRLFKMAFIFFMGVIIARQLGAQQLGLFAYANSLLAVFLVVCSGGVEPFAAREFAKGAGAELTVIRNIIAIRLLLAVPVILGIWLCYTSALIDLPAYLAGALMLVVLASVFNVTELYFQSKGQGDTLLLITLCIALPSFLIKFYLLVTRGILAEKFLADAVEALLLFCVALVLARRAHAGWAGADSLPMSVPGIGATMKSSLPLWMNGILLTVYTRADQLVIGSLLGERALGEYAVAIQISSIVLVIPAVLMTAVFPRLMRAKESDETQYRDMLTLCTQLMLVIFLLWLSFVVLFGELLLGAVYGSAFTVSYPYLVIYSAGVLFICLGSVAGQWAVVEGQFWLSFWRSLFGLALNLALNVLLVGPYGLFGCAWAAVISLAVTNFLLYGVFPSGRPIFWLQLRAMVSLFSTAGLKKFTSHVYP